MNKKGFASGKPKGTFIVKEKDGELVRVKKNK